MGVLIFWQVVSLNDGRADSAVECNCGWVGCERKTPTPLPLVLLQWINLCRKCFFSPPKYLCKEEVRHKFLTCTSLYLTHPRSLGDMWGGSNETMKGKKVQQWILKYLFALPLTSPSGHLTFMFEECKRQGFIDCFQLISHSKVTPRFVLWWRRPSDLTWLCEWLYRK